MRYSSQICYAILLTLTAGFAAAETPAGSRNITIEPQSLASALQALSKESGLQIGFASEIARNVQTRGTRAAKTPTEALDELLEGTNLEYSFANDHTIVIREKGVPSAGAASAAAFQLAQAETPSSPEQSSSPNTLPEELEEIVVTGTHIRGVAAPVGSPLTVIDRQQIAASGHGRVQDILDSLPQNFRGSASEDAANAGADFGAANFTRGQAVDLRGLGASSTLVLVNGRRQASGGVEGSFVDISSIAASAVERIEILTDGASALYGSDAVGGVVNFILRKNYEGVEAQGRIATTGGDAEDVQGALLGGHNFSKGNLLAGYQYLHRDALMNADTPYGRLGNNYSSQGGSDFRPAGGNPGTIFDAFFQPAFAIPAGQDGNGLTLADLTPGANFADNVTGQAAYPEQTQHSAFFSAGYTVNDRFELFAEGRYGEREMEFPAFEFPSFLFVPADNPFYFNPFGGPDPVVVSYNFAKEIGAPTLVSDTQTRSITAGATARLGLQWKLNVAANYARERNDFKTRNLAASSVGDFAAVDAALLDDDATTALNVFGDAANNPATLDLLRRELIQFGVSTVRSISAIADGPAFELPAGFARLAVGLDYRDERLNANGGIAAPATGVFTPNFLFPGRIDRDVKAAFAEAVLPILAGAQGGQPRLELSVAGRYEEYSDFGSSFDPKVGVSFRALDGLKLRGSWGTSFRAPRLNEISPTTHVTNASQSPLADPQSLSGFSTVIFFQGVRDLQPETAESWTAGFDFTPTQIAGLSFGATYFHIDYEDKIQTGDLLNALVLEEQWAAIVNRDPTQAEIDAVCNDPTLQFVDCPAPGVPVAAIINANLLNLGGIRVRGVDFDVGYTTAMPVGNLHLGLGGTRTLTYDLAASSTSPFFDFLDTANRPLALRLRGSADWTFGQWALHAFVTHAGAYRNPADVQVPNRKVDAWTTLDSSVSYRMEGGPLAGTQLQLSVINLFDEEPSFANLNGTGFDSSNANQRGRSISLSATKAW